MYYFLMEIIIYFKWYTRIFVINKYTDLPFYAYITLGMLISTN